MIKEAIILAGGLGTRLRSAVPDLPKCMAPVAGKPFIDHVISYYQQQGISRFVFSLGHRSEVIVEHLAKKYSSLDYETAIEPEPLGTGGAIRHALQFAVNKTVLALNGDTLFAASVPEIAALHTQKKADCTLALKTMYNTDRYGVVKINVEGRITSFHEKQFYNEATINGGVYALNVESFLALPFEQKFSFEKDFLEKYFAELRFFGVIQQGYFIDIGIPEDYERAQHELKSE